MLLSRQSAVAAGLAITFKIASAASVHSLFSEHCQQLMFLLSDFCSLLLVFMLSLLRI